VIEEVGPALLSGAPELLSIKRKNLVGQLSQVLGSNVPSLSNFLDCLQNPLAVVDGSLQEAAASANLSRVVR
jgi:hypothetical protein